MAKQSLDSPQNFIAAALGYSASVPGMASFPRELDDAAEVDGAGPLRIFLQIYLPNVIVLGLAIDNQRQLRIIKALQ